MTEEQPVQKPSLFYRIFHFPLTRIVIGLLVCIGIPTAINAFALKPLLTAIIPGQVTEQMIRFIIMFAVLLGIYALLFRFYENRPVTELAPRYALKENSLGFILGGVCAGFILLILLITGSFETSVTERFLVIFFPLIGYILFATIEEIMFRGIIYRIVEGSLGTIIALLISASLFGLAHITNEHASFPGVLSAASGGLLLGVLYTFTGRLWYPISFHIGWNFFQYFFGLPVSGTSDYDFFMEASRQGPEWFTGGGFGIEDSLLTILLVFGLSAWLIVRIVKTGRMVAPFWIRKRLEKPQEPAVGP